MICAKCGSDAGWDGPKYYVVKYDIGQGEYFQGREWLEFACHRCGYQRREHTLDHVETPHERPKDDVEKRVVASSPPEPWWRRVRFMMRGEFHQR